MRAILLGAVLVAGCGNEVRVVVTNGAGPAVSSWSELSPDEVEVLDETAALWGLQWDLTTKAYGAVFVDFVDAIEGDEPLDAGRRYPDSFCRRVIRTGRSAPFLAHEIGHALGEVEHVDDPENVMHWIDPVMFATDDQIDEVLDGAAAFGACR